MKLSYINLDDRKEVKKAIDFLEYVLKENADGKTTDTSNPSLILTQAEHQKQDNSKPLDEILKERNLRLTKGKSGSANVIGCRDEVQKQFDICGEKEMLIAIDGIMLAWDKGFDDRFDYRILRDVCAFVHKYCHEKNFNPKYFKHLSKDVRRDHQVSPSEFKEKWIDMDNPGMGTFRRYNMGLHGRSRIYEMEG